MKDARLVKILVEQKALVKLLKTIGTGKGYPTRELLTKLRSVWIWTQITSKGS